MPCTGPWAGCLEDVTVLVTVSAKVGCRCGIARLTLSRIMLLHLVSWYLQSDGLLISSSAWSIQRSVGIIWRSGLEARLAVL